MVIICFQGNNHARLKLRMAIFTKFKTSLASVVMAGHAEAVTVTNRSILQELVVFMDFVELHGNVRARVAGLQNLNAALMHLDADVPQTQIRSLNS